MTETKLVKITHQGQLELPSEIVNSFQVGDEYLLWQDDNTIILKKVQKAQTFSDLWQKIDDLGEDSEQVSMSEITAIVKEVRSKLHKL